VLKEHFEQNLHHADIGNSCRSEAVSAAGLSQLGSLEFVSLAQVQMLRISRFLLPVSGFLLLNICCL
jgi:hypothetical protein